MAEHLFVCATSVQIWASCRQQQMQQQVLLKKGTAKNVKEADQGCHWFVESHKEEVQEQLDSLSVN